MSFNPTLVRLRRIWDGKAPLVLGEFQSHAGSIEAPNIIEAWGIKLRFNPTLVRLRQEKAQRHRQICP